MLSVYQTSLIGKNQLTSDVYLFRFRLIEPKELNFKSGQYMILNVPKDDGGVVKRLYSIASPSWEKTSFELLVKIVPGGVASTYLKNLAPGDKVIFEGPAGVFCLKERAHNKVFLVTGTGIAPARSIIISNIKYKKTNTTANENTNHQLPTLSANKQIFNYYLFWGLPYLKDVFLFDELKKLSQEQANFHFKICLSREESLDAVKVEDQQFFDRGHVDSVCRNFFQQYNNVTIEQFINNFEFYLCGNREVVESLKQYLLNLGVEQENIIFEKF